MIKLTLHSEDPSKAPRYIHINPDHIISMIEKDWHHFVENPNKRSEPLKRMDTVVVIELTPGRTIRVTENMETVYRCLTRPAQLV